MARSTPRPDPRAAVEYVYFIQAASGGPIKIGRTTDLKWRLGQLQCGNPERLTIIASVDGGSDLEASLHNELHEYRIRGEWFQPTPAVKRAMLAAGAYGRRDKEANRPLTFQIEGCANCGSQFAALGDGGMCGACAEFRDLQSAEGDPFDAA